MDIWRASAKGDLERVRQLIQHGQDVNRGNSHGTTPLMLAADNGHDQVVQELIRAGADVNGKNKDKETALHWARRSGQSSVVKALAEAGANLNVRDVYGMTPLMDAAYNGCSKVVAELIRAGADVSVVSSCKWWSFAAGSTALHFATKQNKIECGVLLMEAGADLRTRNKDSKSPMGLASHDFRQTALHWASSCGHSNAVATLAEAGANLNQQDEEGVTPLMEAAYKGHANVVVELIRAGADVNAYGKSNIKQTALHLASLKGHSSVVKTLTEAGANLNEQDERGVTPLMWTAYMGHANVVVELIRAGADVMSVSSSDTLPVSAGSIALHFAAAENSIECGVLLVEAGADMRTRNKDSKSPMDLASHDFRQAALHKASSCGRSNVVTTLAEAGANLNEQDERGMTPLMEAAYKGHANVVVELIRAGANVSVAISDTLSVSAGSTALHFAAAENSMECGVLLVEAGADMRTTNKDSKSPLDLASHDFQQAIQQAQSFSTKRIVAVIGYAEHGKSTLIAALQAEGNSLWEKLTKRFTKVQDIRKRTAGIETVQFSSQKYGETLFYDFAGQSDYHGPHQSFLEAMLIKWGVSVTLLLVVKSTDEEDVITRQVTHWLQPLSLTSAPSTPQVVLVGSFLDQVESREEATEKLLRCTQSVQEQFHFNIQGPCLLDCRKPASEGIDQICAFLQENEPVQLNCKTFSYNLRWVLVQLHKSFSKPAVRLHEVQSLLLNDAKFSPQYLPPAEQICHDLTAVGHALFLPNEQDLAQSWLILDLQAILHDVYGTLFSGTQDKINQFGLLNCNKLTQMFPKLDLGMIQEVLVSLEFCIQVDSSPLREELLKLIAKDKGEGWLYFPALVSSQPPKLFPEVPDSHHLHWVCWQLRADEENFIPAHLLQTIILRLAANHVFTHELSPGEREYCCSVWVNGLSWMSTKDVDVAVQISDSSVVQVVGRSKAGPEKLHQYMSTIVSDVIKTTTQLSPKLEATSYIVHPYMPAMWECAKAPPPDSLYPVSSIIRCISDGENCVPSRTRHGGHPSCQTDLTELFGGWSPTLSVVQDMDFKREPQRAQGEPTAPQDGQSHPDGKDGRCTAQQVLDKFRDQFIQDMDSNAVVMGLLHHNIITEGDQRTITMTMEPTQQNEFLHLYLRKCTEDAFRRVCDIISGVKGNPKMSALGTAMKRRLQTAPLYSALPSAPSFPSSQIGAPTADKGPSTEEEALTAVHLAKKLFRAIFDYSPANDNELTLKVGDIVEFLGHEEEGWYRGQLKGQTGVFPSNFVEEVPFSATISGAPTTDGKQLPSVTISKTHPDKPLVPIPKVGGAATPHHDDPTPPTSADIPTHFSIDSHPTLEDINKFVIREVAADWKQVATFLGVEPSVIRIADTDHCRCEHACADIFERWLSRKPGTGRKKRTWCIVLSAVEEAGHKAFSQQLQTEVLRLQ